MALREYLDLRQYLENSGMLVIIYADNLFNLFLPSSPEEVDSARHLPNKILEDAIKNGSGLGTNYEDRSFARACRREIKRRKE
ncbi:MAG: hypothetical protein U9Q06_02025 [Nanoarchaeota archaeon]|nr:hypothetical protein [Nanoarchaeota archaeon]